MNAITINQAEASLRDVIQQIIHDVEPTIVTTETGESVVMLSLEEYNAWQETLYLPSIPAIAEDKASRISSGRN